ncbi:hypothetical protein, partial [Amycolatopsis sp. SID8362]|uniref:hypothetical protein n=1 Tax=Amycolatopsis sp. SID8362 TaxID=2690346 RepID=UPI0019413DE4
PGAPYAAREAEVRGLRGWPAWLGRRFPRRARLTCVAGAVGARRCGVDRVRAMIDAANPLLRGDLRNFEDFPVN